MNKHKLINENSILSLRKKKEFDYSMEIPGYIPNDFCFNHPIAVLLHVYHTDILEESLEYLKNIPTTTDLFISTTDDNKAKEIAGIISNYKQGSTCIKVFPNRGRDIAPMIVGYKEVFKHYKYFIHIHTKKSINEWRSYIFKSLLGTTDIVKSILWQLSCKDIGIVFAQHFKHIQGTVAWGNPEFTILQALLKKSSINISCNNYIEFPSGSMFWGKSHAIMPLLVQDIKWSDFPPEVRNASSTSRVLTGTLAHAIERSILYYAEHMGYKWVKVGVKSELDLIFQQNLLAYNTPEQFHTNLIKTFYSVLTNRAEIVKAICDHEKHLLEIQQQEILSNKRKHNFNITNITKSTLRAIGHHLKTSVKQITPHRFRKPLSIIKQKIKNGERRLANFKIKSELKLKIRRVLPVKALEDFKISPRISIVVATFNTDLKHLEEMFSSVFNQTYKNWELCITDGNSNQKVKDTIVKYCKQDIRCKSIFLSDNRHISGNTNEAINLSSGAYIAFLDHDDILAPNCLEAYIQEINLNSPDLIYSDEDIINNSGKRLIRGHFKPDWSPHLILSYNYITHFLMCRREILLNAGLLDSRYDGAQDYELILRLSRVSNRISHIAKPLYHWRESKNSTSSNPHAKVYADAAGKRAVNQHLIKTNQHYKAYNSDYMFVQKILAEAFDTYGTYGTYGTYPTVSIIVFANSYPLKQLAICLDELIRVIFYKSYEIIIVTDISTASLTKKWLNIYSKGYENIYLKQIEERFNWAKFANYAVSASSGDVLLFMSGDIKVLITNEVGEINLIKEIITFALDDKVGFVGGLILETKDKILSSGITYNGNNFYQHLYTGEYIRHHPSPFVSNCTLRNTLAMSNDFFAISRNKLARIGGFDENFNSYGALVEACIRACYNYEFYNIINPLLKAYKLICLSLDIENINDLEYLNSCVKKYKFSYDKFFNKNLSANGSVNYKNLSEIYHIKQ